MPSSVKNKVCDNGQFGIFMDIILGKSDLKKKIKYTIQMCRVFPFSIHWLNDSDCWLYQYSGSFLFGIKKYFNNTSLWVEYLFQQSIYMDTEWKMGKIDSHPWILSPIFFCFGIFITISRRKEHIDWLQILANKYNFPPKLVCLFCFSCVQFIGNSHHSSIFFLLSFFRFDLSLNQMHLWNVRSFVLAFNLFSYYTRDSI